MQYENNLLQNKRVIITAGAGGIGLGMAEAFVAAGAAVSICDVDDQSFADIKDKGIVHCGQANVASFDCMQAYFEDALKALGGLDILVNNAGIAGPNGLMEDIDPEEWRKTIDVDLNGVFYATKLAIPHLKKNDAGSILNIASSAAFFGYPNRAPYASAKWAVVGMTKTMAMELGPHNIRVNAICPGSVNGDRIDRVIRAESESRNISEREVMDSYLKHVSLKTFVDKEDVANAALFLLSDLGRRISGQIIGVDGHTESLSQH
ncbi:SDR family oxidoreductase [Temperatibacter marinus]|uniref:SDR family oxidoreductase n=1 Tax=Temperatibacter marinus TaxID=1456591 RepID=A0AA52HBL6_9PROT|nr:SDR family oxidoreductase [Temperatibacter marinus]WND03875.1 SDR family oxidoreductase [Temperatibacter marinus]